MNSKIMNRTLGATALLAVLLGSAACGTETVPETDPGTASFVHPKANKAGGIGTTADAAERRAAADKARQDKASTDRWARATSVENKLNYAGQPGRP